MRSEAKMEGSSDVNFPNSFNFMRDELETVTDSHLMAAKWIKQTRPGRKVSRLELRQEPDWGCWSLMAKSGPKPSYHGY